MIDKNSNWRRILAILWILNAIGNSDIIVKPEDTEVRIGDTTKLTCSISEGSAEISWLHYPVGKRTLHDLRYVFADGQMYKPYNRRFQIEGSYNLIIADVEVQDAGLYICQNGGGPGNSSAAELIVLESFPVCKNNMNSGGFIGPNACRLDMEKIQLSCNVNYSGNVPPQLQWSRMKHDSSFSIAQSCSASNRSATCNHTTDAAIEMDGLSFICQTNRSRNIQYSCTTEIGKIFYSIENRTRIAKSPGDVVTCFANTSSTDCNYKWIWYDGDDQETMSEGSALLITREGLHRCEANCAIKDYACTFRAMTVEASSPVVAHEKDTNTTAWIFVLLFLASFGVNIILFIMYFKKEKSPRDRSDAREAATTDDRSDAREAATTDDRSDACEAATTDASWMQLKRQ